MIRISVSENPDAETVNTVLAVRCGSGNEKKGQHGISHLIEHLLLFRGSGAGERSPLNREIRRRGIIFNGHTSHDFTTLETTSLPEHAEFCIKLLKTLAFNPEFTDEEIEQEKKVVSEEIIQMNQKPWTRIINRAFGKIFRGHSYEHPVSGTVKDISLITRKDINDFYKANFISSETSIALLGKVNAEKYAGIIKKTFSSVISRQKPKVEKIDSEPDFTSEEISMPEIKNTHILIAFKGPSARDPYRIPMIYLYKILGNSYNSVLNRLVYRGRKHLNSANMGMITLDQGGLIYVYATSSGKQNCEIAVNKILSLLNRSDKIKLNIRDVHPHFRKNFFDHIGSVKKAITFNNQFFRESGIKKASFIARSMLSEKRSSEIKINSKSIIKSSRKFLKRKKHAVIILRPEE